MTFVLNDFGLFSMNHNSVIQIVMRAAIYTEIGNYHIKAYENVSDLKDRSQ